MVKKCQKQRLKITKRQVMPSVQRAADIEAPATRRSAGLHPQSPDLGDPVGRMRIMKDVVQKWGHVLYGFLQRNKTKVSDLSDLELSSSRASTSPPHPLRIEYSQPAVTFDGVRSMGCPCHIHSLDGTEWDEHHPPPCDS